MAGSMSFTLVFQHKGAGYFDSVAKLCKDFSEPLTNIVSYWAKHNKEKFRRGKDAEMWGLAQADGVEWNPVTEEYYQQKHGPIMRGDRQLFADWLMVRTGDLMRSMTNLSGFAQFIGPLQAVFGQPLDPEDRAKVAGNWFKRQVLFLDVSDKRAIRAHFQDYLTYGRDYLGAKQELASRKARVEREIAQMDIGFGGTV